MLKRTRLTLLSGAMAIAVAVTAMPVQSATLKVSACFPRNHDYVEAFFDAFMTPLKSNKVGLKMHYLGGPEVTPRKKQAPALKRGLIDVIYCPAAYYGGLFSEARLPGLQNQSLEQIRANGAYDMMQEAWGKKLNAHILSWNFFHGQKFFVYTRFDPKLSEKTGLDLAGVKMRSTGLYQPFLKAMGATPINISPGDVYSALERGLVGGLAWPWGSVAKYGWQRFLKYRIEPDFYGATMLMLINKKKWMGLNQAQRDTLTASARSYEKNADAIIIKKGHIDDKKLKEAGMKFIKLKGKVKAAYIKTIYEAKWAQNDKLKYSVDYKKLKSLLFQPK
ncbi:MAG: TRAP transporter substrate-binding protein DctP [Rhodospirillales bacterium]|nr:TRAP transporter substrate-binding protein DctP [Rhodospirillales bacterium]